MARPPSAKDRIETLSHKSGWSPRSSGAALMRTRPPGRALGRMRTGAAVADAAGKPLVIEEVDLDGPKAGEVLVEIKATGVCHTDEFTRSGADPEGVCTATLGP